MRDESAKSKMRKENKQVIKMELKYEMVRHKSSHIIPDIPLSHSLTLYFFWSIYM